MPSNLHEALVLLFRSNRPRLAAELLGEVLGIELPGYDAARIASAERTEARPAAYRADLVVELGDGSSTQAAIVVEVQLGTDKTKPYTWPLYVASVRAELQCPVTLLVLAPNKHVARWASQPIELDPGGSVLHPVVLGREQVPRIVDRTEAARDPELAVLSALAHGQDEDTDRAVEIMWAAAHGVRRLDRDRARVYTSFLDEAVSAAVRSRLEKAMESRQGDSQAEEGSGVVHRLVEQLKALDELETIRAEASRARAEAEQATAQAQQATAEAEQATVQAEHARAEGVARSILTVLSGRGMPVSEQARERILACRDLDVLHDWLRRALTIDGTDELFDATQ
jgi:hypothetical protein